MQERASGQDSLIVSYMTLRKAIGWVGVSLPFAIFLGNWLIFTHHYASCLLPVSDKLPYSLSGYYYTHMRSLFVGGLCAVGVFLLFYNGHDRVDCWLANLAGVSALVVAIFPTVPPANFDSLQTNSCGPLTPMAAQPAPHDSAIGIVHLVGLVGLLSMLALMALRFTKTHSAETLAAMSEEDKQDVENDKAGKSRRNLVYRACFAGIAVGGVLALVQQLWFSKGLKSEAPWLLYAEAIAIVSFGVAWFVKGEAMAGAVRASTAAGTALASGVTRRGKGN